MKYFLSIAIFLISGTVNGQKLQTDKLPVQSLEINMGYSKNGTGDVWGPMFSSRYGKYLKTRLHWDVALTGTIHDGSQPLFFKDMNGRLNDGSIRWATGGVQAESHIGYALIRSKHHELLIQLGGLVRYQTTSYYDHFEILFPAATDLKIPVVVFDNQEPMRTVAVGASGQIKYNYIIKNKFSVGILTGLQTDTNGDTIIPMLLCIGRKF